MFQLSTCMTQAYLDVSPGRRAAWRPATHWRLVEWLSGCPSLQLWGWSWICCEKEKDATVQINSVFPHSLWGEQRSVSAAVMIALPVKPVRTHNMCKEASAKTTTTIKRVFVDAKIQTCTRFSKISGLGFVWVNEQRGWHDGWCVFGWKRRTRQKGHYRVIAGDDVPPIATLLLRERGWEVYHYMFYHSLHCHWKHFHVASLKAAF